jgi:hypothetical protein
MTSQEKALRDFADFAAKLKGDEKSEAQTFLFHLLAAFGHDPNTLPEGSTFEYRVRSPRPSLHWEWFVARCSTLGGTFRYTSDTVFDTFPWPQFPELAGPPPAVQAPPPSPQSASQRDWIIQPRVARHELPWVTVPKEPPTLKGLDRSPPCHR